MSFRAAIIGSAIVFLPAVASAEESPSDPIVSGRTELVVMPPQTQAAGETSPIIYINDCKPDGCKIKPGGNQDDARQNISSIAKRETTISPFAHSDEVWNQVVDCIKEVYAPYAVDVVTEDPGENVLHHEAILAGTSAELDLSEDILGIAVINGNCEPRNNVISYSFANAYPASAVVEMCATVAQESAHSYGLDHALDCRDPMTYLMGCGQKFFRNELLRCGEFQARTCRCSGTVQNSHVKLRGVFGDGTPPPPPEVELLLPEDGATVENGFTTFARASDKRGVFKIELWINGWKYGELPGHDYQSRNNPYSFTTPTNLPEGYQNVEIRASNDLGSEAIASVRVLRGTPCANVDACNDGQQCSDGACVWPEPTGVLGDTCVREQDCTTALCAQSAEESICSELCTVGVNDQCPDGFECISAGSSGVCWFAGDEGGGGCCSVGDRGAPSPGQLLLLLGVAVLVMRRRRRA